MGSRNNWYQVELYISLRYEAPESREQFPPEIMKLKRVVDEAWANAGRPRDLALFMGAFVGTHNRHFYLPPTVGKHCPDVLKGYTVKRIHAPRPIHLKNIIAGSDEALRFWYPEFDPGRSLPEKREQMFSVR